MGDPPAPTTWPGHGPWLASSRVLFALLALYAALVVPWWWWIAPARPPGWHAHEMFFAIGGGALAGYVPTACTSWTGRAPVAGRPVMVLAALYVLARGVMLLPPNALPRWAFAFATGAFLWWVVVIVTRELVRSGRPPARIGLYPCAVVAFCGVAGTASAWFGSALMTRPVGFAPGETLILLFSLLLAGVGGRMVPAFLSTADERVGNPPTPPSRYGRLPFLLTLGAAILAGGVRPVSAVLGLVAGLLIAWHMRTWPWRAARHDGLAAMTLVAYTCLPVGLVLWNLTRLTLTWLPPTVLTSTSVSHVLTIGALCGLVVAVMTRAPARRGVGRLHVRIPALVGFVLILLTALLRVAGLDELSVIPWTAGWVLVLVAHTHHFRDPLPRPVFSARRLPRG